MRRLADKLVLLVWAALFLFAVHADAQTALGETLSGPDSHETGQGPHGHLLGDWGGERSRLLERGVRFDFQYISDSLWNIKSEQKQRLASWNRFRGTVDIDLGKLTGQHGLYFHATALWQGGGNLGAEGAVAWMFTKKGVITIAKSAAGEDKLTEIVLDAGAEDLSDEGENWEVLTDPKDFEAVTEALKAAKITPEHAEVTKIASTYTKLEGSQANAMIRLLETLEDLDDTQNVYSNFDFDEAAVAAQ